MSLSRFHSKFLCSCWLVVQAMTLVGCDPSCGAHSIESKWTVNDWLNRYPRAKAGQIPSYVQIGKNLDNPNENCGGVLISDQYIVTSGDCATYSLFRQTVYSSTGKFLGYVSRTCPSNFSVDNSAPNIGIVKLSEKVEFCNEVQNICLPSRSDEQSPWVIASMNYKTGRHHLIYHGEGQRLVICNIWGCDQNETYVLRYCDQAAGHPTRCQEFVDQPPTSKRKICEGDRGAPIVEVGSSHKLRGILVGPIGGSCSSQYNATMINKETRREIRRLKGECQ